MKNSKIKVDKIIASILHKLHLNRLPHKQNDSHNMSHDDGSKPKNKVKKYRKKPIKLKYILSGLSLLIIVVGGIAGYFLSQQDQDIRQQASSGEQIVDLTFNPNNISANKNQVKKIPLIFDAHSNHISVAEVKLRYNKDLISVISINRVDLPLILSNPQITNEQASFTFAVDALTGGFTGVGTLAEIEVKLLQEEDASITIDQSTLVAVTELDSNAVGNLLSNKVTITPTATPTPNPSSTPTQITNIPIIKSCNEACINNSECEINHYCYNNQCRLVTNANSTTCETTTTSINNNENLNSEQITEPTKPVKNDIKQITNINCNDSCNNHSDCHSSLSCFSGSCRLNINPKSTICRPPSIKTTALEHNPTKENNLIVSKPDIPATPSINQNFPLQTPEPTHIENIEEPKSIFQEFLTLIRSLF